MFKVQEHTEAKKERTEIVCRKGESLYYHRNKGRTKLQRGTRSLVSNSVEIYQTG